MNVYTVLGVKGLQKEDKVRLQTLAVEQKREECPDKVRLQTLAVQQKREECPVFK